MSSVIGVDVGGTTVKAARFDRACRPLVEAAYPTPVADGPTAVVSAVRAAVRDLCTPDVAAVGVVVPGAVDAAAGVARYAANLGWRDVPVRDLVAQDVDVPVALDHDVRAAGRAEQAFGRLAAVSDGLLVVIGTGIAGVVVSRGELLSGATGLAGEIGHLPIYPDGEACACGQRGCLEGYASASGLARRYADRTGTPRSAEAIAARLGTDTAARAVWDDAVAALGLGLATCTLVLDPAVIVLGGGLSRAGEALRAPVATALAGRLAWRPAPPVALSELGGRAGLVGAALLAWQTVDRRPDG